MTHNLHRSDANNLVIRKPFSALHSSFDPVEVYAMSSFKANGDSGYLTRFHGEREKSKTKLVDLWCERDLLGRFPPFLDASSESRCK